MSKVAEYRYVQRKFDGESQFNLHVKEMIEMLKNEEVKTNLYVKAIKLSKHALERFEQHFGIDGQATATKMVKDMLSKAVRIGTVLAFDGRINVLYAYQKTAYFLSPDLKTVVTINKYEKADYKQILNKVDYDVDNETLIQLHLELLKDIEAKEEQQVKRILDIERKVREANDTCVDLLFMTKGKRKQNIKSVISAQNHELKQEGWKLFNLKVEKRHVCKSLVALY